MNWRWAAASKIGTSHLKTGTRLQDAYSVSKLSTGQLVAIVSDGAGSAEFGAQGAWLTCRHLKVCFREWFYEHESIPGEETVLLWIDDLRDKIAQLSQKRNTTPRQFAATLTLVFSTQDLTLLLQIGDSCATARKNGVWEPLCWPENGEYASSTYFITDSPSVRLNYITFDSAYDAFALFSDGVGDLSLDEATQTAHPAFFEPMIRPIDKSNEESLLPKLSEQLQTFLASDAVCDKTDDDKTLILISGS
ncbi:PP2C family serine/threonine-protein phosphatase [Leucothrix pacifica]|uniref:Serine/threonine protein phosphatase n=1 Tax=Leucothrix pacifica TaxID=1247513 RepID=A0A317CKI2_9GAMM|nr:PP2C family serine/threonine-protein phosphatase [Leucothrix pacifica]PWQ96842.1 serine/threonine protein phosphatase [Leucothrix pacifica]